MANCAQCGRKLPAFSFGKKLCQWCVQNEIDRRGEGDENARQPVMAAPWIRRESRISVTQGIFAINAAVFLGMLLSGISATAPTGEQLVRWGAIWGPSTLTDGGWRLITYMFLHGGIVHIAINMWCLWRLGTLAETLYGSWTFAVVYFISGIAGGLASTAWNPLGVSVGASGAIFGIAGALVASYYLGEFSAPQVVVRSTLGSVVLFVGYSVFVGMASSRTDNAAHIGGLVAGLAMGALIAKVAPDQDNFRRRLSVLLVVALMVGGGVYWLRYTRSYAMYGALGRDALQDGKTEDGIRYFEKAARLRPSYLPTHMILARLYGMQKKYPQAETELEKVIELQPQLIQARYGLGYLYLDWNRPSDAKKVFSDLISTDPNDANPRLGLAMALSGEGNDKAAIEEYKTVLSMAPETSGVYFNLGNSYAKLKMYDEAIDAYRKQQADGSDIQTELALSDAYRAKGLTQLADEAKNKAEKMKAENSSAPPN